MTARERADATARLVALGVPEHAARAYAFLVTHSPATARAVAEGAGLHRTRAYGVLEEVEKLGLAEALVGEPRRYVALPISGLLERESARAEADARAVQGAMRLVRHLFPEKDGQPAGAFGDLKLTAGRRRSTSTTARAMLDARERVWWLTTPAGLARFANHGDGADALDALALRTQGGDSPDDASAMDAHDTGAMDAHDASAMDAHDASAMDAHDAHDTSADAGATAPGDDGGAQAPEPRRDPPVDFRVIVVTTGGGEGDAARAVAKEALRALPPGVLRVTRADLPGIGHRLVVDDARVIVTYPSTHDTRAYRGDDACLDSTVPALVKDAESLLARLWNEAEAVEPDEDDPFEL